MVRATASASEVHGPVSVAILVQHLYRLRYR